MKNGMTLNVEWYILLRLAESFTNKRGMFIITFIKLEGVYWRGRLKEWGVRGRSFLVLRGGW